ncbi:MAG: DUF937 domain-containing protein [Aestuariivirgaceae bacterium]|jgi:Bacterial protein of unknown function (DUF937)
MAANLVSQILQAIKPEMTSRIASALGIKASDVQEALAGSVPAILAVLVGVVSKPDGARRLIEAATQLSSTGAVNSLGAGNAQAVGDKGLGVLSSLLGGSSLDGLTSAIARYSGLGQGNVSTLIGLVAPFVMNGIRQEAGGLDAAKITNLLVSQKDSIAAALPSGLSSSEVLAGLRSAGSGAAQQAGRTAQGAAGQVRSNMNWVTWAIPLILIAGGLWYFLGRERAAPPPPAPAETTAPAPAPAPAPTTTADPTTQATSAIDTLKAALEGITDSESAKAALPKLQDADGQLGALGNLLATLSPDQKKALAAAIMAALPALNPLFDKVLAIPGVADIAKPVIDGLRAKLDQLSKA